jgi:NADPH:quinone reductase
MRAVLVKEFDRPEQLVIEEVPPRQAAPGEVVISVKACGVNFLDGLTVKVLGRVCPGAPEA